MDGPGFAFKNYLVLIKSDDLFLQTTMKLAIAGTINSAYWMY